MMSSTICSNSSGCYSHTNSTFDDLSNIGKILGIVIGSILGLAVLICVIAIIYLTFCKRRPQVQVWTHPLPTSVPYRQSISMYPYANYSQEPIQQAKSNFQKIVEEPPPAYEEINGMENLTERI
ncbi:unnamed protein product [Rotaria sordida]|uniref:Uncharacterized protein n=1 Tax=Rotaria sordida TaxID=392033 RepID=A0A814LEY3_9BILA|nr:unnamed protein product [Rotaria sordida]CAF3637155.1 unnamed protein product [Rotaria sordida]